MKNIVLLKIDNLRAHEKVNYKKISKLKKRIEKDGCLKNPIIVDGKSLVVLDGHHRLQTLKLLGYKKIPVFLVNYQSQDIRVYFRRKDLKMKLLKQEVIKRGHNKNLFPYKTTRHLLQNRPRRMDVDLEKLK